MPYAVSNKNTLPIAAIAAIVVLIGWFILSHSSRRIQEITGIVEATMTRPQPRSQAETDRTAMVRMPDDRLIEARIVTNEPVRAGQRAKIAVIEDVVSGERTYELTDVVSGM